MTALIDAAQRGDINGVMQHIDQACMQTESGRTALMSAATNNHVACVKVLVSKEARLQNTDGWTALIYAVMDNYIECAKLLLVETRLTIRNRWDQFGLGTTALMVAATYGYEELVSLLIPYEARMIDSYDSTALMCAVRDGNIKCAELLANIEYGIKGAYGMTALMTAAMYDRPTAIQFLRNNERFILNEDGWTALMYATYSNNVDCVRLLLCEAGIQTISEWGSYGAGTTALMIAASRGLTHIVYLLKPYEQGLEDSDGHTASWHAQYNAYDYQDEKLPEGHLHILSLLEDESSDRSSPPSLDKISLFEAAISNSIDLVQEMIGDAGQQDLSGCTALMKSAYYGHVAIVSLLLDKEQRLQDCDGLTALHYAILGNNKDCAKLLLSENDICEKNNRTPLDFGLLHGHDALVMELLDELKEPNESAFDAALRLNHTYCAAFLRARYAKISPKHGYTMLIIGVITRDDSLISRFIHQQTMRDKNGWTALMHVALLGHADYMHYFLETESGLQSTQAYYFKRPYWKDTTALMIASTVGHIDIITELIEVELGYTNKYKETALMHASEANNVECAKLLLKEAGNQDCRGLTALMKAAVKGNLKLVNLLADLEGKLQDSNGYTALMHAAQKGRFRIIKRLTEEIGMCDSNGWTALMHVALYGSAKSIQYLSAEIGMKSTNYCMTHPPGTTALMIAAAAGKERVVEKLLAQEINNYDSDNNCALFFAIQHGHYKCALLLLSEACSFDANGALCFTKLREFYQANLDTEETFITCYKNIIDSLMEMFFLRTKHSFSPHLLLALFSSAEYQRISSAAPCFSELLWAAVLNESENALDELDNYFFEIEESHTENSCIICIARQPDCVLLPCRHLVICSFCAEKIYNVESIWKCPYCRAVIENMYALEEHNL